VLPFSDLWIPVFGKLIVYVLFRTIVMLPNYHSINVYIAVMHFLIKMPC